MDTWALRMCLLCRGRADGKEVDYVSEKETEAERDGWEALTTWQLRFSGCQGGPKLVGEDHKETKGQ